MFFKDALASEPCCIEAVPELLRLGAKEEDVRALLQVPHLCPPPTPPPPLPMTMIATMLITYSHPCHSPLFPKCLLLHPGCVPCHSRSLYHSQPLTFLTCANVSFSTPILLLPLPPPSTIYRPLSPSTTAFPSSSCAPVLSSSWGRCSRLLLAVIGLSMASEFCCSWRALAHCMLE